ncbi:MAG: pimeloyl-CoA dehydrogenase large subunit, partial [Gemmatimonadaceae bacterium]|nr:pimeloyl-CoA dehydrogenase large subunit [Caulobacter sp.]
VKKIAALERADDGGALIEDPDFRLKIAELEIAVESLNATELRIFSGRSAGKAVGPASSMLKLAGSETQQAITELALEAVGTYAAPFVRDTWAPTNEGRAGPDYAAPIAPSYFSYRKTTIYAGSSEIQKNIITKLVLGL